MINLIYTNTKDKNVVFVVAAAVVYLRNLPLKFNKNLVKMIEYWS